MMNFSRGLSRSTGVDCRNGFGLALAMAVLGLACCAAEAQKQEKTPDFGPNVLVLNPAMAPALMQAQIDRVYKLQQQSEFG
jgi:hypothetical protein